MGHFASPFAQGSCPQNPATAPGGIWGDTGKSPRPAEQGQPPAIPPPPLPTTNITKPPKSAKGDEASCISLNTGRNLLRGKKTQNKTRLLKKYQKETNEVRHLPLAGAAPEGGGAGLQPACGGAGVQAPLGGRAEPSPQHSGARPAGELALSPSSSTVTHQRRGSPEEPPSYPGPYTWKEDRRWHRGPGAAAEVSPGVRTQPSPAWASEGAEQIRHPPRGARLEKHEPPSEALGEHQAQKWDKNTSNLSSEHRGAEAPGSPQLGKPPGMPLAAHCLHSEKQLQN